VSYLSALFFYLFAHRYGEARLALYYLVQSNAIRIPKIVIFSGYDLQHPLESDHAIAAIFPSLCSSPIPVDFRGHTGHSLHPWSSAGCFLPRPRQPSSDSHRRTSPGYATDALVSLRTGELEFPPLELSFANPVAFQTDPTCIQYSESGSPASGIDPFFSSPGQ
jgi:hypothetical protein